MLLISLACLPAGRNFDIRISDFFLLSCFSVTLRAFFGDPWQVFFSLVSATILICFTMPAAFGLQNFTQWGGMYDDHWCHAETYSRDPEAASAEPLLRRRKTAGNGKRVYSAPAHNRLTCVVWSRMYCGTKDADGWTVAWVSPRLQSQEYIDGANACDLDLPGTDDWFTLPHAKE